MAAKHFAHCLRAVLRKNLLLKRREWVSMLLELLLPVALMGLLIWIRTEIKTEDIPQRSYLNSKANNPTWFPSKAQSSAELPQILQAFCNSSTPTGMCPEIFSSATWSQRKEYYLGVAVDGLLPLHMALHNQQIGVVGEAGKGLAEFVEALPGYKGFVRHFTSEGDFDSYIKNSAYGYAADVPQLFGAIHMKEAAVKDASSGAYSGNWDVVIQLNATGPGSLDINGATDINTKLMQPVRPLQKGMEMHFSKIYWSGGLFASSGFPMPTGGFVDLQSLIYAWVYNSTGAFSMPSPEALPKCQCEGQDGTFTDDLRQCRKDQIPTLMVRMLTPYWSTTALPKQLHGCLGRLSSVMPLSLREVPFPTPAYTKDTFAQLVKGVFGLFFVLVYIWPMTRIMKSLVQDKEENKNEVMKMMGMSAEAITVGWYATYSLLWLLPSFLIVLICWTTVFAHSDKFIIFLFFWLFGLCVISMSSFIAVFFSRAKTASVVGALIMFLLYFPYLFVSDPDKSPSAKTWSCLSPPVALSFGAGVIAEYESAGVGVQWDNLAQMVDNFAMGRVLFMMVLDVFMFAALSWYLDKVLVVGFGTRQSMCFLFSRRYWQPLERGLTEQEVADLEAGFDDELPDNPRYEPVGPALAGQRSILLRGLSKEFHTADGKLLKAVQGVTMNLYTSQVFCLLGHNGAGKSTTINMLSGMLPVDSGDAIVYGNSVKRDMPSIRTMLGICPQHDVIWHSLTVREHLEFFAELKGVADSQIPAEVQQIISDVGLQEKQYALTGTLSGGQKRRLSAAIALIGGSKVVFLDEPSSGVDPFSRRELWDCLRQKKEGRTVILTTHFMDEAEELGDRIAIMAAGQVKCVGSSLFLKSKYGVGYTLSITKRSDAGAVQIEALKALILQKCRRAEPLSEVGSELVYRMPMEESSLFPELFEQLEQLPEKYGTELFSVSITTLEEVFLRVGQDHTEADIAADERLQQRSFIRQISNERVESTTSLTQDVGVDVPPESQSRIPLRAPRELGTGTSGSVVFFRHVHALLAKRYHNARRDRKAWCCQVAMPLIFLLFALVTMKFAGVGDYAATPVSLEGLPGNQQLLYAAGPGTDLGNVRSFMDGSTGGAKELTEAMNATAFDSYLVRTYYRGDDTTRYGALRFQSVPDWANPDKNATVGTYTVSGFRTPGKAWGPQGQLDVPVGTLWGETDRQPLRQVPLGKINNRLQVDLFWNSTARDALPAMYHGLHQQLLRSSLGKDKLQDSSVKLSNKPFPLTSAQKDLTNTQTSLNLALGFAFIPASVGAFVVLERENRCKHLQLISGVNFVSYWLSTWIWDVINYLVPAGFSILLIVAFQIESLTNGENLPWTLLCVLMYGISCTSFTYMLSFLFNSHTSAQNLFLVFYLFTGGILMIVAIILAILPGTADLMQHVLIYIFRLLPNFCLADALTNLVTRSNPGLWMSQGCPLEGCAPYDLKITGYDLLYMGVGSIVWFLITLVLELALATPKVRALLRIGTVVNSQRLPQAQPLDRHVQLEKERVLNGDADEEMVVLKGIRKVYPGRYGLPPKVAVEDMYFGIPEGECFGYLGMNGAGKTTTMRILTGEELCTSGEATLGGYDIKTQQSEVRRLIGYCPQFDALIGTLTAREHLTLFARIKGVAPGQLHRYVESMLERLTLRPYADKQARTFSGGTRRKLSLGIALIGDPRCIFLDEPTTGVDPESRRFMWMLISSTMQGRSVILTTHSMDECEALCGRIGIMVNGQLVCLGSAGLLKATHGYGYQFEVAFNAAADLKDAHLRLRSFLEQIYPEGTQCLEGGGGQDALPGAFRQRAKFRLPKGQVPISMIFREVERRRVDLDISEYMISETTLEQLFIQFAKHQRSDEDPPFQPPVLENVGASLASAASTDQASSRSALQVSDSGAAK